MQCSCQRRDNPPTSTSTSTSRRSNPSRPYQQIVLDSTATGNTRFEWITSTTTHSSPDETRSRVRSHVMQRFRAQQALGQYVPPSNRADVFPDHDPRIECYFTCRTCGRLNTEYCRETTTDRDVESHNRGILMRSLPIESMSESGQLYEYLAQVYVFIQNPIRRTGLGLVPYCLPFIISSAAVLNALLSMVATHRFLMSGGNNSRHGSDLMAAYYYHKVQAIQIVNQSLARHSTAVAYDVQVAIAVLAIIEVCAPLHKTEMVTHDDKYTTGTIDNARNHMAGLREIMAAHGGTVAAPADHHLSFGIVRLANKLISTGHQDYPTNNESIKLDRILSNLPRDSHPSTRSMFHSLNHLSTTMPRTSHSDMAQQSAWLDQLNLTELKMHRTLEIDLSPRHQSTTSFVTLRAYPIAGSIFLCLWLRQLSLQSNVFDYLVDSLAYALKETGEDQYPSSVYLWLLFVGGAAAEGRRNRRWFLAKMSSTLQRLKLDSSHRVHRALVVFPYVDECDLYFRRIWEELQTEEDRA